MTTALVATAAAVLIGVLIFLGSYRVALKQIVGVITFHEYAAGSVAEAIRGAAEFYPKVEYCTHPTKDDDWYKLFVMKSPDAEKFLMSVNAQLHAKYTPPLGSEG